MADTEQPDDPLTVGRLRAALAGLPDDAPVFPDWAHGPPGDADPAVEVTGFVVKRDPLDGRDGLCVLVDLHYLDEFEDEEEEDDEEED